MRISKVIVLFTLARGKLQNVRGLKFLLQMEPLLYTKQKSGKMRTMLIHWLLPTPSLYCKKDCVARYHLQAHRIVNIEKTPPWWRARTASDLVIIANVIILEIILGALLCGYTPRTFGPTPRSSSDTSSYFSFVALSSGVITGSGYFSGASADPANLQPQPMCWNDKEGIASITRCQSDFSVAHTGLKLLFEMILCATLAKIV